MRPERKLNPPAILRPYLLEAGPDEVGEWGAMCPLHIDNDPSASFNFKKGVWICHAGCGAGKIKELINKLELEADIVGESEPSTTGNIEDDGASIHDLNEHRVRKGGATPDVELTEGMVQQWLGNLMADQSLLIKFMNKRGLTEETIEHFEIGWDKAKRAYTIPIRDINGCLINIRFYRPDASGKLAKYHNLKGYGRLALFPVDQIKDNHSIVICEGELDALLCIQNSIKAISVTGGAGNWNRAWTPWFKDKAVRIVYDRDEPGMAGARTVARHLRGVVESIGIIALPFPVVKDHGEDITDFFVKHGMSVAEFRRILANGDQVIGKREPLDEPAKMVQVLESLGGAYVGKTLQMRSTIIGRSTNTHLIPQAISFECSMDAGPKCQLCPMLANAGQMEGTIPKTNPFLLKFLDVSDESKDRLVRDFMGIQQCNRMAFEVKESHVIETLVVRSSIDHAQEDASDHTQRGIIAVGTHDSLPGQTVRFTGTISPGPKDQQNYFLAWEVERDKSAVDAFEMTQEIGENLKAFQPIKPQMVLNRLYSIADDLADHTTRIYGRPELHILFDLTYHSVISFMFDGQLERKGWLDVLVVGDTRTGKSETAQRLVEHYGLGSMVSCEAASFAGVVGGLVQKFGREWSVIWGAIPLNDRRIVVLDEIAGLSTDEIAQLSSVRSSGVAQLTKVEAQAAMARTRLIWLGNPRDGRSMNHYSHGYRAIQPLIGNMEDVARFDLAFSVSSGDVPPEKINVSHSVEGEPKFAQADYRNLILWVWSRKTEDVEFEPDATAEVFVQSGKISNKYVESPPLVQIANFRMKLARIAVAIAGRVFSTDENFEKIVVCQEHVMAASKFIRTLYDSYQFGYGEDSKRGIKDDSMAEEMAPYIEDWLERTPQILEFLRRHPDGFTRIQIEENLNMSKESANGNISKLFDSNMTIEENNRHRLKPILLNIIRRLP